MNTSRRTRSGILLLCVVVVYVLIWTQRNTLLDWLALHNYAPPSGIAALATRDTMTDKAKEYLYINHPEINDRTAFNKNCPNNSEQSVVLGCFLGDRQGIYIFNVTASELKGVQEVTTAHEMLHQAYERLSTSERKRVDGMLDDFYQNKLADDSIKQQIELYKKSEPDALHNEMHSLFGTEVSSLPGNLESYYSQYFTKRSIVAGYYASYQAAFNERKAQIDAYDQQLAEQKSVIDELEKSLKVELAQLDSLKVQLDSAKRDGEYEHYNALVRPYNDSVSQYNADLETLKAKLAAYNDIVAERNAIADQEQALQQNLSSKSLPSADGE